MISIQNLLKLEKPLIHVEISAMDVGQFFTNVGVALCIKILEKKINNYDSCNYFVMVEIYV